MENLKHSTTHPKYLHSNSTSHKWAFGAIAELVDNSVDAKSSRFYVDTFEVEVEGSIETERVLSFQDNGIGMASKDVHKMLSFGHCDKVEDAESGYKPIGHYGNGFKSGSMRLGTDALVFTKDVDTLTVGFLSQTFLKKINADEVLVPMTTFDQHGKIIPSHSSFGESKNSLRMIKEFSIFKTENAIREQFDYITSKTGTRILIFGLKRQSNGCYEFDFSKADDIQLPQEKGNSFSNTEDQGVTYPSQTRSRGIPPEELVEPERYSLRGYLKILYLDPHMQMYVGGVKVRAYRLRNSMYMAKQHTYKPLRFKDDSGAKIKTRMVFGFNKRTRYHFGMMLYHKNRLIKQYVRVGIQNGGTSRGRGVIGLVDAYFLTPTHNKQDFIYDDKYRLLMEALANKLLSYWQSCNIDNPSAGGIGIANLFAIILKKKNSGPFWIQCDKCLKWRRVEKTPDTFAEDWTCDLNPDKKYGSCSEEQEKDTGFEDITGSLKKLKDEQEKKKKKKKPVKVSKKRKRSTENKPKPSKAKKRKTKREPSPEVEEETEKDSESDVDQNGVISDKSDEIILKDSESENEKDNKDKEQQENVETYHDSLPPKKKFSTISKQQSKQSNIQTPATTPKSLTSSQQLATETQQPHSFESECETLQNKLKFICSKLGSAKGDSLYQSYTVQDWLAFDEKEFCSKILEHQQDLVGKGVLDVLKHKQKSKKEPTQIIDDTTQTQPGVKLKSMQPSEEEKTDNENTGNDSPKRDAEIIQFL